MKRYLSLVFVGWAALLVAPLFGAEAMYAHFINVGQADSILLEFPCGAVLIDAGVQDETYKEHLIEYLDSFFKRRIDLNRTLNVVFVTHSHVDHTNALKDVAETFTVKNYVDNGIVAGSGKAGPKWVRKVAEDKHIHVEEVSDDRITKLDHKTGLTNAAIDPIKCDKCDPKIVVLVGGHEDFNPKKLNNESLAIRVDFGASSFLFPGDAEKKEIAELLDYYDDTPMLKADVLKVGHHGSHNATTDDYLKAIRPKIGVCSIITGDHAAFRLRAVCRV